MAKTSVLNNFLFMTKDKIQKTENHCEDPV